MSLERRRGTWKDQLWSNRGVKVSKWIDRVEQRLCISSSLVLSLSLSGLWQDWSGSLKESLNSKCWNSVTFNYINSLRTVVHYRTVSDVRLIPPTTTTGCDDTPALCQILHPCPNFSLGCNWGGRMALGEMQTLKRAGGRMKISHLRMSWWKSRTAVCQAVWSLQSQETEKLCEMSVHLRWTCFLLNSLRTETFFFLLKLNFNWEKKKN